MKRQRNSCLLQLAHQFVFKPSFFSYTVVKGILYNRVKGRIHFFTPKSATKRVVHAIRTALGMSQKQLSKRMGKSPTASQKIELREQDESITLKSLKEVGQALDMKFVYGFIPQSGSLENMIEARAREIAKEIVLNTSHNMALEDQKVADERLKKAIKDQADQGEIETLKSFATS